VQTKPIARRRLAPQSVGTGVPRVIPESDALRKRLAQSILVEDVKLVGELILRLPMRT
jgi:hypothetical protein